MTAPKMSHKLNADQKQQLIEWLLKDFTPVGIQALIEQQRREAPLRGQEPFPALTLSAIRWWRKNLYKHICREKEKYDEEPQPGGLLDPRERLQLLRQAAEVLVPHLGQASSHGVFTANEQFVKVLHEIDRQQEHMRTHNGALDPHAVVKSLTTEELKQQITLLRARKQG